MSPNSNGIVHQPASVESEDELGNGGSFATNLEESSHQNNNSTCNGVDQHNGVSHMKNKISTPLVHSSNSSPKKHIMNGCGIKCANGEPVQQQQGVGVEIKGADENKIANGKSSGGTPTRSLAERHRQNLANLVTRHMDSDGEDEQAKLLDK